MWIWSFVFMRNLFLIEKKSFVLYTSKQLVAFGVIDFNRRESNWQQPQFIEFTQEPLCLFAARFSNWSQWLSPFVDSVESSRKHNKAIIPVYISIKMRLVAMITLSRETNLKFKSSKQWPINRCFVCRRKSSLIKRQLQNKEKKLERLNLVKPSQECDELIKLDH